MSSEFSVRLYKKGDEEQIIPLLDEVFKDWLKKDLDCTPQEHYEWLYWDNPEKKNPTVVAEKDGKIIGVNHGLYLRLKIGGKVFLCLKGTDLAVHPSYRGKGVSGKIDELHAKHSASDGSCMGFYLTKNPIVINSNLGKGGLSFPGNIQILVKIDNIESHLSNSVKPTDRVQELKIKYGFITAKIFNKLKNILTLKTTKQDFKLKKITKFDDMIEPFWDQIKDEYDFILEKTSAFLNWRYCDRRAGKYEIYVAEENGAILGLMILRINRYKKEYPEGYIMELLTLPRSKEIADTLLSEAVEHFDREKINVIYATVVKDHSLEKYYYRHGFLNSRYKTFVGINPSNLGKELDTFMNAPHSRLNYQYDLSDTI